MKISFKSILEKLIELIYPPKCVLCDNALSQIDSLCSACQSNLKISKTEIDIPYLEPYTAKCYSLFEYKDEIRAAICRFKFNGYKNYSDFFSKIIYRYLINSNNQFKVDYICSVPMTKKSLSSRGYNHAEIIAGKLSDFSGIEHYEALIKIKENSRQHQLGAKERFENVKGVYDVQDGAKVIGKTFLLVDDIITTGNTLKECAKTLYLAGAKKVICCTISYAKSHN